MTIFDDGSFSAPFFIYIKAFNKLTDLEVLERLGYHDCERVDLHGSRLKGFYITEDENWTHVIDNWSYQLWYMEDIREHIERLANDFDIYYCSVGDIDFSFDFIYYQNGSLRRKYVVHDPEIYKGKVAEDFGAPFKIEEELLSEIYNPSSKYSPSQIVMRIANFLGIDTDYRTKNIRRYITERKSEYEKIYLDFDE